MIDRRVPHVSILRHGIGKCWRDKDLRWSLFAACILSIAFVLREKIPRLKNETRGTLILITLADVGHPHGMPVGERGPRGIQRQLSARVRG